MGEMMKRKCRRCGGDFLIDEEKFAKLLEEKGFEGKDEFVCRGCMLDSLND